MSNMTPREIVHELDKHIIGQDDAKRAVAIALRNRWRRMQVSEDPKLSDGMSHISCDSSRYVHQELEHSGTVVNVSWINEKTTVPMVIAKILSSFVVSFSKNNS